MSTSKSPAGPIIVYTLIGLVGIFAMFAVLGVLIKVINPKRTQKLLQTMTCTKAYKALAKGKSKAPKQYQRFATHMTAANTTHAACLAGKMKPKKKPKAKSKVSYASYLPSLLRKKKPKPLDQSPKAKEKRKQRRCARIKMSTFVGACVAHALGTPTAPKAPAKRDDAKAPAKRDDAKAPAKRDDAKAPAKRDDAKAPAKRDAKAPAKRDAKAPAKRDAKAPAKRTP